MPIELSAGSSPGFLAWLSLAGALLLFVALASAYLRRLPVSTSALYLVLGGVLGPYGLGWVSLDVQAAAPWLERVTEIAVVMCLFSGGLKLRLPVRNIAWRVVLRLAGPLMLGSIACVALLGRFWLGLDLGSALLLGAVLSPTDPVLASAVSVNDAADKDRVRYGLSGEAGLNDGMAFPFVVLALAWAERGGGGPWLLDWALRHLLWAVPAGLAIGFFMGRSIGRLSIWLRSRQRDRGAPTELLALALIALSYVAAELVHAWGFLAVFAAGFGLRRAELKVVLDTPHPDVSERLDPAAEAEIAHPPAEDLVPPKVAETMLAQPAVAAGVLVSETLSFGQVSERLVEVSLVMLVGAFALPHWDARALVLAFVLFVLVRPLCTHAVLFKTATSSAQRWLMGWFGVRGIGSLYYLSYALNRGAHGPAIEPLVDLTISVVALSIVAHGMSAHPLLARYELSLRRAGANADRELAPGHAVGT